MPLLIKRGLAPQYNATVSFPTKGTDSLTPKGRVLFWQTVGVSHHIDGGMSPPTKNRDVAIRQLLFHTTQLKEECHHSPEISVLHDNENVQVTKYIS